MVEAGNLFKQLSNMPKDLKKQIENHLATWPERHNDVLEMRQEWKEFKKDDAALRQKAFWVLIGFTGTFIAIGIWVGNMQSEMGSLNEAVKDAASHHDSYDSRIGALEINNGEIRTRLTSIEVTLQEIKTAIIRLQ